MIPEVMQAVTCQSFQVSEARLYGYERFCLVDEIYPGIVETGQSFTSGKVYYDVDAISLKRLDYFEDEIYARQPVELVLPGRSHAAANVYIVPSTQASRVSSQLWSEDYFRATHLETFLIQVKLWMGAYNSEH